MGVCIDMEHFKKSLGSLHLSQVYPSPGFIDHAVENTHAAANRISNTGRHYTACVKYNDFDTLKAAVAPTEIHMHVSYTSAEDDLVCVYMFATTDAATTLRSAADFTMLEPVPTEVRLDASVHQLQYHYLSQYHQWETVDGVSGTPHESPAMVTHPMVLDATNGSELLLSVMLRPGTTKRMQEALAEGWLLQLTSHVTTGTKAAEELHVSEVEHLFWASSSVRAKLLAAEGGAYGGIQRRTMSKHSKPKSKDTHAAQSLRLAAGGRLTRTEKQILNHRSSAWATWSNLMKELRANGEHVQQCAFDQIVVSHQRSGITLSLPNAMLDFAIMNDAGLSSPAGAEHKAHAVRARRGRDARRLAGACFAELIAVLSAEALVTRVALSRPMRTLNSLARQITQLGTLGTEPFTALGLDGTGVVVGISDTGIDETSCYFRDKTHGLVPRSSVARPTFDMRYRKIVQYITYSGSAGDYALGHGSHVAGTVAGKCDYEGDNDFHNNYRGMASGAKIAFLDVGVNNGKQELRIPDDLGHDVFGTAKSAGARIHSNSWGGGYLYDAFTLATDEYLYRNPDFLVVYAGGNSGSSGAYTVNSPALSKNALAVACSDTGHTGPATSIDKIASFSSHGPTLDGRIKPEITAPGNYLMSAAARAEGSTGTSCATAQKSGTSMAAPVVAGTAALVLQYFQDPDYWAKFCDPAYDLCSGGAFSPSGTLLKALMLQSGKPVTGYDGNANLVLSVPDTYQGFGRVDLTALLPTVVHTKAAFTLYMDDHASLAELQENVYTVTVTSSAHPLKVTVSWFDPPNEVFAARFLLHDLDLVLESPSGQEYFGNALVSNDHPALGAKRDEVNNNEQVTITAPDVGDWKVRVQAKRLTQADRQGYSLAVTAKGSMAATARSVPLSPAVLAECAAGSGTPSAVPRVSLEVAKYAKLFNSGWSPTDNYAIIASDGVSPGAAPLYSGRIAARAFEVDQLCVPAGCYTAVMNVTSTTSKKGAHMGIPECGVFVAPLAPQQDFCITSAGEFLEQQGEIPVFSDTPCMSSCEQADHLVLPLYLGEYYEGAGWAGTYYAIQRVVNNVSPGGGNPLVINSAGANTMDWGFEEVIEHCLPLQDTCYWLQLSVPEIAVKNDMEYPVLYFLNSVVPGHATADCPFELNSTVTLAKLCVHDSSLASTQADASMTVTFYRQKENVYDLGQGLTKWSDFARVTAANRIAQLGTCTGPLFYTPKLSSFNKYDTETPPPTTSPSAHPSFAPSKPPTVTRTAAPSAAPTQHPSPAPSATPTAQPSGEPTLVPTVEATVTPSTAPTMNPTGAPNSDGGVAPEEGVEPPSALPTAGPSPYPSVTPTAEPSVNPTAVPSAVPTDSASAGPTEEPTFAPTAEPTTAPSTSSPTVATTDTPTSPPSSAPTESIDTQLAAIYENHRITCLSDCPNYPGAQAFVSNPLDTCLFLADLYHLCTSYAVGYGYCTPPKCALDCNVEDWCYFGSGLVVGCPDGDEWLGSVQDAVDIQAQCVTSTYARRADGDDATISAGGGTAKGLSSSATAAIGKLVEVCSISLCITHLAGVFFLRFLYTVILVIIAVAAAAIVAFFMCFPRKRSYGELLPTDSTHSESGDALHSYAAGDEDSTHGSAVHRGASLSSLQMHSVAASQRPQEHQSQSQPTQRSAEEGTQQSQTQQQQRKPPKFVNPDKLRSLLARSADFLSSRRLSPKSNASSGKAGSPSGRGGRPYDAVRSPFSIVGDEDDDEGLQDDDVESRRESQDLRV
jgi:hypothetical protein